ncbi:hypothetical protein H8E52_09005 [bacterium]|nr:hypothetical protein [bacterium]
MSSSFDFDRNWIARLKTSLDEREAESEAILAGGEKLNANSSRADVIDWTRLAMERLEAQEGLARSREIMSACSCAYPPEKLADLAVRYAAGGDLTEVHQMLQDRFDEFLEHELELEHELIEEIHARGMGLAGLLQGDRILATKIPASANLRAWFAETDAGKRRSLYCHCPRVHEASETPGLLADLYCYCGAGFYQGIWETILGHPVRVELLSSVLRGDEVCQVAIYLSAPE